MVGNTGDLCNKCGNNHNMTAAEAQVGLFQKGSTNADVPPVPDSDA